MKLAGERVLPKRSPRTAIATVSSTIHQVVSPWTLMSTPCPAGLVSSDTMKGRRWIPPEGAGIASVRRSDSQHRLTGQRGHEGRATGEH